MPTSIAPEYMRACTYMCSYMPKYGSIIVNQVARGEKRSKYTG